MLQAESLALLGFEDGGHPVKPFFHAYDPLLIYLEVIKLYQYFAAIIITLCIFI